MAKKRKMNTYKRRFSGKQKNAWIIISTPCPWIWVWVWVLIWVRM